MNIGYNLSHNILGFHIGLIIPDILLLLEYKNDEYNIIKRDYELKGYLYPVDKGKEIINKIDIILEKIKNNKVEINDYQGEEDDPQNIGSEFNDLLTELSNQKIKPFSIFYKIQLHTFIDGKYKYYRIYINNDIISGKEIGYNDYEFNDIIENSKDKNKTNTYKKNNSKESKKKIIKNLEEKNKKKADNNENSTLSRNSKITNELKNKENNSDNKDKSNKNNHGVNEKNKGKQNQLKYMNSLASYRPNINISSRGCNKVRNYIIKKKETFPLKIMKILCYIFGLVLLILMLIDVFIQIVSFNQLAEFLTNHLIFNRIKVNSAVLYSISVNIRWLSHSLYMNSESHLHEKWSTFYENLLQESLYLMQQLKETTSIIDEKYSDIFNRKYEVNIYIYKFDQNEKLNYTLDNFFAYIINNGIKLMDQFDYFINNNCEEISKELGLNESNLKNLIETTYYLYSLDIDLYKNKEEEKKKADEYKNYFPFSFLFFSLTLILILIIYIYYIISFQNIEIGFLDRLINFNSNDFDSYIKKLEEIKKKLRNDTSEEEVKEDDIEFNDLDTKKKEEEFAENENLEEKQSNEIINKSNKKKKNKQSKIQQQRRKKLNFMISFFRKKNILFLVQIIIILFLSLTYYLISAFINSKYRNEFINFDAIHDSLNKVYSDSFDIFISLKRQLDYYEKSLNNCKTIGKFQPMKIKKINEITIPKFGNLIMQITSISAFKKETLEKFTSLYSSNACQQLMEYSYEISYCENFWTGVLSKGMEQGITQMGVIIGAVLDELRSLNNSSNGRILLDLMKDSAFIEYEQFNEYYLFKAYNKTGNIFKEFRNEKLESIKKLIMNIFYIYIVISFILFCLLNYFIYNFNYLFSSFLNFIGILPLKFLSQDRKFYFEVVKFGDKYF